VKAAGAAMKAKKPMAPSQTATAVRVSCRTA
jgi:hypothetical protein